jgi:hypothetical protein
MGGTPLRKAYIWLVMQEADRLTSILCLRVKGYMHMESLKNVAFVLPASLDTGAEEYWKNIAAF